MLSIAKRVASHELHALHGRGGAPACGLNWRSVPERPATRRLRSEMHSRCGLAALTVLLKNATHDSLKLARDDSEQLCYYSNILLFLEIKNQMDLSLILLCRFKIPTFLKESCFLIK